MRMKSTSIPCFLPGPTRTQCVVLLVLCMLFLTSCSGVGRYSPAPTMAAGVAKNIKFSKPVAVVNAQDSQEEHILGFQGIVVNYHEFTQSVVDALKAELAL